MNFSLPWRYYSFAKQLILEMYAISASAVNGYVHLIIFHNLVSHSAAGLRIIISNTVNRIWRGSWWITKKTLKHKMYIIEIERKTTELWLHLVHDWLICFVEYVNNLVITDKINCYFTGTRHTNKNWRNLILDISLIGCVNRKIQ